MTDLTVTEWQMTDMQHWHELAQAWSAFQNGLRAGAPSEDIDLPD